MTEFIQDISLLSRSSESLYDAAHLPGEKTDRSIECLVLPGGGIAGAAFGGVLKELEARGYRAGIKYWVGSSAGAICAAMGALGASADFMISKLVNTDKKLFLDFEGQPKIDDSWFKTIRAYSKNILELFTKLGTVRPSKFVQWFEEAVSETGWSPNTTFADLYDKTGRHLVITGTSMNTYETIYFSRSSYPNMKIVDAVHISMSLPFIFQPTLLTDPTIGQKERFMIDGAVLDCLPLNACDFISPTGEILGFNRKAVGFTLVSHGKWVPDYVEIDGLLKYSLTFISNLRNRINISQSQQPYFWNRIVPVETYGVDSIDFDLDESLMKRLIQSGQESARLYLDRREAMIEKHGPLPRNLFIPSHRLRCQGVSNLSNDFLEYTQIYATNPEKFLLNDIPATENYHLWS